MIFNISLFVYLIIVVAGKMILFFNFVIVGKYIIMKLRITSSNHPTG
jgi:hypothetical protein